MRCKRMSNWRKLGLIAFSIFAITLSLYITEFILKIYLIPGIIYLCLLLGSFLTMIICFSMPGWLIIRKLREDTLKKVIEKFPEKYIDKDHLSDLKYFVKELALEYYLTKQSSKYVLEMLQDIDSVNIFC